MVKKVLSLLFVSFLFVVGVMANSVSAEMASLKAQELMTSRISNFTGAVSSVVPVQYQGENVYYVVQFTPGGWALISADDNTTPLLGYSDNGVFQLSQQPENVSSFLNGYSQIIKDNSISKKAIAAGWNTESYSLLKARVATRTATDIAPLITVNWNQTKPYNKYCPSDNAHGQSIVGCVAVAMAQAMSVAQYPARPNGIYSYTSATYGSLYIDYDKEAAYNWSNILSGANSYDDVAHLLYHCGVSINMDYGPSSSGTQDKYIVSALQRNFSYSSSVKYYARKNYTGDWEELIQNELKNGRAVCLSGQDIKGGYGHCFNLDGYSNGAYHVNWGWGGANNGYFQLDGLKDNTMNMDYSDANYQSVIVGIRPPSEKPSDILLSNNSVEEEQPAGAIVGAITVESEAVDPIYTYTLVGEYSIVFHKNLPAPFKIDNGNLITTEPLKYSDGPRVVTITATNSQNSGSVSRIFTIQVISSTGIENNTEKEVSTENYYNISGEKLTAPQKGINIVKHVYTDGTIKTEKIFNK
jgi:hypothetical protein